LAFEFAIIFSPLLSNSPFTLQTFLTLSSSALRFFSAAARSLPAQPLESGLLHPFWSRQRIGSSGVQSAGSQERPHGGREVLLLLLLACARGSCSGGGSFSGDMPFTCSCSSFWFAAENNADGDNGPAPPPLNDRPPPGPDSKVLRSALVSIRGDDDSVPQ